MIVDAHCHIYDRDYRPRWWWEALMMRMRGLSGDAAWQEAARIWEPTGDSLIKEMDEAGIDMTLICHPDHGLMKEGDCPLDIEEANARQASLLQRHPGRFIYGVGVDPRRTNAVQVVERFAREYGARAVKLYPPAGWYPDDRTAYPFYERCIELNLVACFHTGPGGIGLARSHYAHPFHLEDVAVDFPELQIVAYHAGGLWWRDMLAITANHPNMSYDLSGWQRRWQTDVLTFYRDVREFMDGVGHERILFATDVGAPPLIAGASVSRRDWVGAFRDIPESVRAAGIDFSPVEREAMLGGNAMRLFTLPPNSRRRRPES